LNTLLRDLTTVSLYFLHIIGIQLQYIVLYTQGLTVFVPRKTNLLIGSTQNLAQESGLSSVIVADFD